MKEAVEKRGGGLAACLMRLGEAESVEGFRKAILKGDTSALSQLAALSLAGYSRLEQDEIEKLLLEGLTTERPIIIGRDADGLPEMGSMPIENPRAAPLLKISELLGRTASQQVITPKARGEKAADEGIGKAGHAAFINAMRRRAEERR